MKFIVNLKNIMSYLIYQNISRKNSIFYSQIGKYIQYSIVLFSIV